MVLINVYTRNIKIKYKSTPFSKATFLVLITELFTIIFSFIIGYNTGGFWLKQATFYEQPKVSLLGDYILMATTNNTSPVVCSTYPFFKKRLQQYNFCSVIKFREIDHEFDGKNDEVIVEISLNLYNFTLKSINLVLPIKYQLSDLCPLKMQSLIFYQYNFQQYDVVTELKINAHLQFFQSSPILCSIRFSEIYNFPVIENKPESKNYALENIMEKYLKRNFTTHLTNVYAVTKTENKQTFTLRLLLKYPEHHIYYNPGFWQILKTAWIQYIAIYILLAWLSRKIRKYIFNNRLVWYYEDSPINKKSNKHIYNLMSFI
ncbi:unnamed protein product [Psylliodes chrysocephalus]|uniref:Transmembrane protein 231 n=1 Tax=Psylliodes chrysocephalus TaxID=3402493 RepID=A0A9P0CZ43_9CUCU|nr:unnamed protein product [Psylliodes chrysocephala]